MSHRKDPGRAVKRRLVTAPPRKKFNLRGCLIESAIAIVVVNIIAGFLAWYFVFSHPKH